MDCSKCGKHLTKEEEEIALRYWSSPRRCDDCKQQEREERKEKESKGGLGIFMVKGGGFFSPTHLHDENSNSSTGKSNHSSKGAEAAQVYADAHGFEI